MKPDDRVVATIEPTLRDVYPSLGISQRDTDVPVWIKRLWRRITDPSVVYIATFVAGALMVIPYIVHPINNSDKVSAFIQFTKEVGFAYMIAAILGFSIEKFNQARHQHHEEAMARNIADAGVRLVELIRSQQIHDVEEFSVKVAKDVISAVYGKAIPASVLEAVTRFVLLAKTIRRSLVFKLDIYRLDKYVEQCSRSDRSLDYKNQEDKDRDKNFVAIVYTSSWIDQNVTPHPDNVDYNFALTLEGPAREKITGPQFIKISHVKENGDVGDFVVNAKNFKEIEDGGYILERTPQRLRVGYTETQVPASHSRLVQFGCVDIQDLEDEYVLQSVHPCTDAILIVSCDPDLALTVTAIHSEDEQQIPNDPTWNKRERRWKIRSALLPAQGFVVNWKMET